MSHRPRHTYATCDRRLRAIAASPHRQGEHSKPRGQVAPRVMPVLMIAGLLVALIGLRPSVGVTPDACFQTVTVTEGTSLWSIASTYPVPGLGVAETVELIRTANNLHSSVVYVGQTLQVPASQRADQVTAAR